MSLEAAQVGIGLRQPHYQDWLACRPPLGFVEVHSENFFAPGGASLALLDAVRAQHPVSLHGVGLSLGSACGLDEQHLAQLAALVARTEPVRVSDHACFARVAWPGYPMPAVVHASDLLPVAFTADALAIMVAQVSQVQDRLGRPILVENLSAYVQHADPEMHEVDFLLSLCRQSGCQLLLDLHNLMVNGLNRARTQTAGVRQAEAEAEALQEAQAFVHALPRGLVGEVHLAGCVWPSAPEVPVIDDHSRGVSDTCWQLYESCLAHLGPLPTLIEWDTDLPDLDTLLTEASRAEHRLRLAIARGRP